MCWYDNKQGPDLGLLGKGKGKYMENHNTDEQVISQG